MSGLLVAYLLGRRLMIGPEAEGLVHWFSILFFMVSVAITGIGIVGEICKFYDKLCDVDRDS